MTTTYSEASYFDGNHCQHVADYEDENRRKRIQKTIARRYKVRKP